MLGRLVVVLGRLLPNERVGVEGVVVVVLRLGDVVVVDRSLLPKVRFIWRSPLPKERFSLRVPLPKERLSSRVPLPKERLSRCVSP